MNLSPQFPAPGEQLFEPLPLEADNHTPELRVTVDGARFYTFLRPIMRSADTARIGDVVISVRNGKMLLEAGPRGTVLPCTPADAYTVRIPAAQILGMLHFNADVKVNGPLELILRPSLGQIAVSHPHPAPKAEPEHKPNSTPHHRPW
jgi:hypothetical protein